MAKYKTKQVIVVRKDLNMRKGKIAAQVSHASLGAIMDLMSQYDGVENKIKHYHLTLTPNDPVNIWLAEGTPKIVVGVDSLEELMELQEKVTRKAYFPCLPYYLVTDYGYTEFHGENTITCSAIGPWWVIDIDEITGKLKLL